MLTLYLDSGKIDEIIVKLVGEFGEETMIIKTKNIHGSQIVLQSIQAILAKKKQQIEDITAIQIPEEPGSYTGRRVGASVANALSYTLNVPINGNIGKFVYPSYE